MKNVKTLFVRFIGKNLTKLFELTEACRLAYLKGNLAYCGEDVKLYPRVSIIIPETVNIGSHTHIGENVHIRGGAKVTIGEWCQIANNTIIVTGNHIVDGGLYYGRNIFKEIEIDNNVWIGANAIILPGVKIKENSVVGAGSVVTKDVPPNSMVAGVPAKVIKTIR